MVWAKAKDVPYNIVPVMGAAERFYMMRLGVPRAVGKHDRMTAYLTPIYSPSVCSVLRL
jgi:hypothetical protein